MVIDSIVEYFETNFQKSRGSEKIPSPHDFLYAAQWFVDQSTRTTSIIPFLHNSVMDVTEISSKNTNVSFKQFSLSRYWYIHATIQHVLRYYIETCSPRHHTTCTNEIKTALYNKSQPKKGLWTKGTKFHISLHDNKQWLWINMLLT